MSQQVRILIVEEDEYALNFMSLLIQRDRRTRVAGRVHRPAEIPDFLDHTPVDLILLGGDPPFNDLLTNYRFQLLQQVRRAPPIVVAASHDSQLNFPNWNKLDCRGWLIKDEIGYSLTWALILAAHGKWVVTPGVAWITQDKQFLLEHHPIILEGTKQIAGLTAKEAEKARLAFLFRFKAGHSIKIPYCKKQIDDTCRKLGLLTKQNIDHSAEQFLIGKDNILHYFGGQLEQIWGTEKLENKVTDFAFLLLTLPEIHDQSMFHP